MMTTLVNTISRFTGNTKGGDTEPSVDETHAAYIEQGQSDVSGERPKESSPGGQRHTATRGPHAATSASDRQIGAGEASLQSAPATSAPSMAASCMDPAQPVETTIQSVEWEELVHLRNEIAKKEREASDWQHNALTLKCERDMKHSEAEAARRDLSAALEREAAQIKRNEELRVLLETRRRELQDAQRFMGTIDTSSEGDVFRHLRELNAGIFNLARSMSETQVGAGNASNRAKGKAEEALVVELGSPLLDMLKSFDTHDDAILFEISIQAVVTSVLFWMISTWTNDPDGDAVVSSIHKRIQHTESQSVAGQWRALTWKAAQTEFIGGPQWEHHCKERLVTVITHAAALSGMRISVSKSKHMETIAILAEKASKIRHLIGEAMVGSDYEIVLPRPESPYATAEMEEAYAPKGKSRRQGIPVLCSTTLGLRRVETVQGKRQATMLVKPAVCLDTLLEDLGLTDGGEKMSTSD